MSVDGQVLGASTVAGGGATAVAELANTGNSILIGLIAGFSIIIVLGVVTRLSKPQED